MTKENIIAFLKYDDKNITKKWFLNSIVVSAAVFCLGVFYSKYFIVNLIFVAIINILAVSLYVFIGKRIVLNKKWLNLFAGIYLCEISLALFYLSYHVIRLSWDYPFMIVACQGICIALVVFSICKYCSLKVKKGKISNKSPATKKAIASASLTGAVLGITFSRLFIHSHKLLIIGIAISAMGLPLLFTIIYICKYHYYKVLEEMESEKR